MKADARLSYSLLAWFFLAFLFVTPIRAQIPQEQVEKIHTALQVVKFAYIDSVEGETLVEDAIKGMLKELDPHSVYLSAEDLRRANEALSGSFEGIGIQFNIINDTIVVVSPVPGGPSEKVGIMPGDKIVTIEGESATGTKVSNEMVQSWLRGERGTKVQIGIYRPGQNEILDFTITRDKIPIDSVDAAFMATPETGYIKISRFARTTIREFHEAFNSLEKQGMKNLILDLNYNSGGYLDVAVDLTDQFLEREQLIVYTEGRAAPKQSFSSTFRGDFKNGKLVVLINEGSASASEILAGAVQDWDRGLLVGRRSFGKGLVQRPFELPDGSAIRLTVAAYHTPTGRNIQKPYDQGNGEYMQDLNHRLESGELVSAENIDFPDSLKYTTLRNQRVVYGGGGIMPDFFVPLDTTRVSPFYSMLLRRGTINNFGIEYTNQHRDRLLGSYPDAEAFLRDFQVDQSIMDSLIEYARNQEIETEEGMDDSEPYIRNQLKAHIARNLFDFAAYVQVSMQMDEGFRTAIEIIEDDTFDRLNIHYQ
ncbi:MAG: S41 family peptidase [Bacteroidales bacterium]